MTFFTLVVEHRPARSSSTTRQFNFRRERSRSRYLKASCRRIHEGFTAQHLSGLAELVKSYLGPGSCLVVPLLQSNRPLPRLLSASGRRSPLTRAPINEDDCITAPDFEGQNTRKRSFCARNSKLEPGSRPACDRLFVFLACLRQCS